MTNLGPAPVYVSSSSQMTNSLAQPLHVSESRGEGSDARPQTIPPQKPLPPMKDPADLVVTEGVRGVHSQRSFHERLAGQAKCETFPYLVPFHPHYDAVQALMFPFYRQENHASEKSSTCPGLPARKLQS